MESKLVAIVEGLHYEVHRRQGYGAYDFSVVVGPGGWRDQYLLKSMF
jgi:hypothetical protein